MKKLILLPVLFALFALPANATCTTPGPFTLSSGNGGFTIAAKAGCTIVVTFAEFGVATQDLTGSFAMAAVISDKDCPHLSTSVIQWQRALGVSQYKPSDGYMSPATVAGVAWSVTNDIVGSATCVEIAGNAGSGGSYSVNVVGKYI